jgi:hypothetical protein
MGNAHLHKFLINLGARTKNKTSQALNILVLVLINKNNKGSINTSITASSFHGRGKTQCTAAMVQGEE